MTIMKRLLVCLLCGSACAESRPPLVWGGSLFDTTFFKDNGIKLASNDDSFSDGVTLMNGRKAPDVYGFYSGNEDLAAMVDAGLLADLSSSDIIREWTERLRPDIRDYVTDESGHIFAIPDNGAYIRPLYWRKDAWDAAGYAESDVPQSYTELLDFLDGWIARIAEQPSKTVCVADTTRWNTGTAKCNYMYWLLDVLVSSWEMQTYYAGETLNFDTPEFIALLERTRDVGLRLYKTEPHTKKRQKMLPLFQNGVIMYSFNDGLDWGLSRTVPFRITADQPKLMRMNVSLSVIRADSLWKDALMACFEDLLSRRTPGDGDYADLYVDTQPGEYRVYPDSDETAVVTAGYLADLDAYEGAVCLAPSRTFYLYEGKLLKFMKGELSAEKLAAIISVPKTNPNK